MKRILKIHLENDSNDGDEHDDETIVSAVLHQIQEGYTSGYQPTWYVEEES